MVLLPMSLQYLSHFHNYWLPNSLQESKLLSHLGIKGSLYIRSFSASLLHLFPHSLTFPQFNHYPLPAPLIKKNPLFSSPLLLHLPPQNTPHNSPSPSKQISQIRRLLADSTIRAIREACPERSRMDPWVKIGKIFRQFSIKSDDTSEQKLNFLKNS